jgi:hypothetical protein
MTVCQPKKSTYISLLLIVLFLALGLLFLLFHFSHYRTFGLWFYVMGTSLITVVLILLLVKMMAGFRFLSFGNNAIQIRLPLRGKTLTYAIHDILVWEEDAVLANKRKFNQVTIVLPDKTSVRFSNHEHTNYDELLKYLRLKIPNKSTSRLSKAKSGKK